MRQRHSQRIGCRSLAPALLAISLLLLSSLSPAQTESQRISLTAGWNLISLSVQPLDPSPASVLLPLGANFQALWAYDGSTGEWRRYPQPTLGAPTITQLETGRGYWLQVTTSADLDLIGLDGALAAGPDEIAPGWNLVGFPIREDAAYDRVLSNAAIRQVWMFDQSSGSFRGVVIDVTGLVTREDFIDLEPGQGYWIFSNGSTTVAPVLQTTLPADVDVTPLLDEDPPVDAELPWTTISAGDWDIGRDGLYDRSLTQRFVDFEDRITQHQLVLSNGASGVLQYRLSLDDPENCPWLRFKVRDPSDGSGELLTEMDGWITTERAFHTLVVNRTDLSEGSYNCSFSVVSNGVIPTTGRRAGASPRATEPVRTYHVAMTVGGLEGDYRLRVEIDTVNGKTADLANPRITLSLYADPDGLKAIVDTHRNLLFSEDLRLAGRIIESDTTRFEVDGSYLMPAAAAGNPFAGEIRRDFTLRGTRSDRASLEGAVIGSPDLNGTYFETIRGVTDDPILLVGTFFGERLGAIASVRDQQVSESTASQSIPDDGFIESVITVTDPLLIDEVDLSTTMVHSRPSDLVVSVFSPDGTQVLLRSLSGADLGSQIFDEFDVPVESLDIYNGKLANGDWTLRVEDQVAGETGDLLEWSLDIRGTQVHDIAGTVGPTLPVGTTIILSGCGRTEIVQVGADRSFRFENLIDCVYQLRIDQSAFLVEIQEVVLAGSDIEGLFFEPAAGPVLVSDPIILPQSPQGLFIALTTDGGAGLRGLSPLFKQQYGMDSATWDLDRAPLDPGNPGEEDSNAFLGVLDIPDLTRSNAPGSNGTLDGPVGPNSLRMTVNIGMPVIGRSVQGDLTLEIGAQP